MVSFRTDPPRRPGPVQSNPVDETRPASRAHPNEIATLTSIVLVEGAYLAFVPSLPDYLRELGVHSAADVASWTGLVLGLTPLIVAVTGPFWGKIGDRFGIRLMALRATLVLWLVWILMVFVTSPGQFLVLRVAMGLLAGYQSLVVALATNGCAPERTGLTIARVQITQVTTAAVSPALGGVLAPLIGIRSIFGLTSAACFCSFLGFLLVYRETGRPVETEKPWTEGFLNIRPAPGLTWLALMLFLSALIDRSFQPAATLFAAGHAPIGESAHLAGWLLSIGAVGDGLAAWYCGRKTKDPNLWRFLMLRFCSGGLVCLALFFTSSAALFAALRFLYALAAGGMQTVLFTLASRRVPDEVRTSQFAVLTSCLLLGHGAGALLTGYLATWRVTGIFLADVVWFAVLFAIGRKSAASPQTVSSND